MQIADEAPEIYNAADRFIEAADWVIWQLTGKEMRSTCTGGYKAIWHKHEGYPSNDFFKGLNPKMENLADEKLSRTLYPVGTLAGGITPEAAKLTGLMAGTAVAVGNVDAHVSVPAVGITSAGKMLAIMGTSTCHMLLGEKEKSVPGMCGVVEDGIIEGFFGYEAGGNIPTWTYVKSDDGIYVNLYIGGTINVEKAAGTDIEMVQKTDYPWKGDVSITVNPKQSKKFTVYVRVPDRKTSELYTSVPALNTLKSLTVNGTAVPMNIDKGYIAITREWKKGDRNTRLIVSTADCPGEG